MLYQLLKEVLKYSIMIIDLGLFKSWEVAREVGEQLGKLGIDDNPAQVGKNEFIDIVICPKTILSICVPLATARRKWTGIRLFRKVCL